MTLQNLERILKGLKKETKRLYDELNERTDGRYKLGVNGIGVVVLADMTNMENLARGEKECQTAMKSLLGGAN